MNNLKNKIGIQSSTFGGKSHALGSSCVKDTRRKTGKACRNTRSQNKEKSAAEVRGLHEEI